MSLLDVNELLALIPAAGGLVVNSASQCRKCRKLGFDPGSRRPLEKEMATHSSILAWEIPDRGASRATVYGVAKESDTI